MRYLDESEREAKLRNKAIAFFTLLLAGTLLYGKACTFSTGDTQLEFSTEDSSLDDLMDLIQKKMGENSYYSQKVGSDSTCQDVFLDKLAPFLIHYYSYLGDEEIATLLYFIDYQFPTYDFSNYSYKNIVEEAWDDFLEKIISNEYSGYGLRKSMLCVSDCSHADSYKERYKGAIHELFTLFEVVGYENLMSVIFENGDQKIVDVICAETSIDQERARRLVQLFDIYYEYSQTVEGIAMCPDLLDEMRIILCAMIESKCESNPEFNNSVIALVLKNSYLKEDRLVFEINRFDNNGTFLFQMDFEDYGKTTVRLPLYYLNAHMDSSTLVDSAACYIIRMGYERDYYSNSAMPLLSYIVDWNRIDYLAKFDGSVNRMKKIYYQSLEKYFSSEEEFNQFLVALDSNNEVAIHKYFSIWKSKMMDGPITFTKLLEYNSLRETITSRCSLYYSDYSEAALITEKSPDLDEVFRINDFYFYPTEYDYMAEFDEVMDYFHAQNSSYTELISASSYWRRDWVTGDRSIDVVSTFVLSQPLSVQSKDLGNGNVIHYYVKPEVFESGEFVYAFTNVLNQRTEIPISGISTVLENEETGKMEEVMIVSLNEEAPYGEAYYKTDYFNLYPKEYTYYLNWND